MKKSLFFAAAVLTLTACTREMDVKTPVGEMTITARTETSADTRTVMEGKTHVYWEPGDEIVVFSGRKVGKFTTDITTSSATADFNGTLSGDAWTEGMDLWAVYPFSDDAVFDGETITTTLPSEQVARFGSFGKGMNLSVAHSDNNNLQFYNVGGGIRFFLTRKGIKKVTFEGYGGEFLSGKVKIGLDGNGLPMIREVTDGSKVITLLPPSGYDSFPTNVWFYCVAIPGSLDSGFKLEFYRDSGYSRKASEKAVTIKRSIFGSIAKADEGCEFFPNPNTIAIPDPIDLGLSVKWASFNLGASKPEEYGNYYAWGDTETKSEYTVGTYQWITDEGVIKYCPKNDRTRWGGAGDPDGKTVLDPEDDAAHVNLGGLWRMPTRQEWKQLCDNCTWTGATLNGVKGMLVTASNGNSIFLPTAGALFDTDFFLDPVDSGAYWSSSLAGPDDAYNTSFLFEDGVADPDNFDYETSRWSGLSVRPVFAQ